MPYKNPEDKRRWEREHRQERNARRRQKHLGMQGPSASPMPDPVPAIGKPSGWDTLASIVVGIGVAVLAIVAGAARGTYGAGQGQ